MNGWSIATAYYHLSGATMLGFFVAALFFLRFWRRTKDRLFLLFAISFFVMGAQRAAMIILQHMDERTEVALYGLRFLAFLVILFAIIDKNRAASGTGRSKKIRPASDRDAAEPVSTSLPSISSP